MDTVKLGTTEAIEAEFGCASESAFTLIHFYDDQVVSVEGFNTKEGVLAMAKSEEGYASCPKEYFW